MRSGRCPSPPWYRRGRGPLTKMHLRLFAPGSGPPSVALARATCNSLRRGHSCSLRRSKQRARRPGFLFREVTLSFPGPGFRPGTGQKPARNWKFALHNEERFSPARRAPADGKSPKVLEIRLFSFLCKGARLPARLGSARLGLARLGSARIFPRIFPEKKTPEKIPQKKIPKKILSRPGSIFEKFHPRGRKIFFSRKGFSKGGMALGPQSKP